MPLHMQVVALSRPVLHTPYEGQVTEMIPSSYTIPIAFVRSSSGPAQYHQRNRAHATILSPKPVKLFPRRVAIASWLNL
jgi:hypothetical protein